MIIGLCGFKRSGKNTAAKYIESNFGDKYKVVEHSFAGKLKQSALAAITGEIWPEEDAIKACESIKERITIKFEASGEPNAEFADVLKNFSLTGREYLQWYGTEAHRKIFGQDFWTKIILDKIPNPITPTGNAHEWDTRLDIITDVRFPDEAKDIKARKGKIVRINSPRVEETDSHASEQGIPKELVDVEIWNGGSLEQFAYRVVDGMGEVFRQIGNHSFRHRPDSLRFP